METYALPWVKQTASGIFCLRQGAQPNALGQPRGAGRGAGWEGTYVYLQLIHVDMAETTQY